METKSLRINLIATLCLLAFGFAGCRPQNVQADRTEEQLPRIFPDYIGVTFPVNIAPANFYIQEKGDAFHTEMGVGEEILYSTSGSKPEVIIPEKAWRTLLQRAQGK